MGDNSKYITDDKFDALTWDHLFTMAGVQKFHMGLIVITPGAAELLEGSGSDPSDFLSRHSRGDWGDIPEDDIPRNNQALIDETRIISAYKVGDEKIWIITEADRSSTTILLPEEY